MFAVGLCWGCIIGVLVVIAKDEEIEKKHERRRMYSQLLVRGDQIMDAVEYVKTKHKMCASFHRCNNCPLKGNCGAPTDPEGNVKAVEQWAKEHPPKTRQSEFLKMFPNAVLINGVVIFAPCNVDKTLGGDSCAKTTCEECTKKYWTEEIE